MGIFQTKNVQQIGIAFEHRQILFELCVEQKYLRPSLSLDNERAILHVIFVSNSALERMWPCNSTHKLLPFAEFVSTREWGRIQELRWHLFLQLESAQSHKWSNLHGSLIGLQQDLTVQSKFVLSVFTRIAFMLSLYVTHSLHSLQLRRAFAEICDIMKVGIRSLTIKHTWATFSL